MPNTIQFFSKIEQGHISENCRKSITVALKSLEGKFAKITIKERKKNRSLSQNAFYWGVIVPEIVNLLNVYGNNVDAEQVHDFLKAEVGRLTQKVVLPDGEVKAVSGTTTELSTVEFEDYITKIRAWAGGFGVIIPMPNE